MSQINEDIVRILSQKYPTKSFKAVLKIDPISFDPWVMIACNDKETPMGYFPKVAKSLPAPSEFVSSWILHNAGKFETF